MNLYKFNDILTTKCNCVMNSACLEDSVLNCNLLLTSRSYIQWISITVNKNRSEIECRHTPFMTYIVTDYQYESTHGAKVMPESLVIKHF